MRVSDPLFGLMLKHVGASATTMPSNEIYAAMQSGSLDGVVTTYETILSLKIFEQAKFATVGSPALFMGFSPLIMSLGHLEAAHAGAAGGCGRGGRDIGHLLRVGPARCRAADGDGARNAGVSVRRMTRQDYLAWLQVAQQTAWLEYTKISPRAQELVVALVHNILQNVDDPN